ncbi:pyridoxal 5'-phosphate synthase [Kribbella speibonae]|uniref:Pyridoxal 5'-phosphate synthase n=1 Tax=Kribbella speibonae TaxID=1572660 RepID=A0A4R0JCJ6_9ACTN|nr:pyridoxal 5'-phosphate synthase [Kribbella speibonae]TCC42158.1 pyridoxal 5'-phosphate synthase [Kribbella speibonae]
MWIRALVSRTVSDLRTRLRAVPTLTGTPPSWDPSQTPETPYQLFVEWLLAAIDRDVVEPCAATLSTVRADGRPNARVLILKNVTEDGWQFASSSTSRKGEELETTPYAALTFYWIPLGRQVRVSGRVVPAPAEESARDFLLRPPAARAEALVGRQSAVLADRADIDPAAQEQADRIAADPELIAPNWTLYTLRADEVEFWQADPDRRHLRLRYRLDENWTKELLWP